MLSTKFLIVLCLGVLAVQAKPKLKNQPPLKADLDKIVRDLEQLNAEVSTLKQEAIEKVGEELRSLDRLSADILHKLGADLQRDLAQYLLQVSGLQERAYELGVDISACVGDTPNEVTDLSNQLLGEASQCLNQEYVQAQLAVEKGAVAIGDAVARVDEYWSEVDSCRQKSPIEQRTCSDRIEREIQSDRVRIPANIDAAVDAVLRDLDLTIHGLHQCSARKIARFEQEGGFIIKSVVDCVERTLPPVPTPFK